MRIAVFLPNWIGDVVMATPALRALRRRYPEANIIAVARPYVRAVLDGAPWFDRHVPLGRGFDWWNAVRALRAAPVDLAVLFPNSLRSGWVAWVGGCRRRIGFDRAGRGLLLTDRLYAARDAHGRFKPTPIIDDYNRLAQRAGCDDPGRRMELFTTAADEAAADQVMANLQLDRRRELICLNPGAAFGAAKHWPTASFAALAHKLHAHRAAQVLVLCGPGERELARDIQRLSGAAATLADQPLSLGLTRALVRRCQLLITTDSGPRHFAAAFDRPVVTLFGPTHIAWTETYFAKAIHLQKQVPCGPCQQRVCPTDHACMTTLQPDDVFAAAQTLLRTWGTSRTEPPERRAS